MQRTNEGIVHVSNPTPHAVWGKDLETSDGLTPKNGDTAKVWNDRCSWIVSCCKGIPVWPFSQTFFDFSSSSSVRL